MSPVAVVLNEIFKVDVLGGRSALTDSGVIVLAANSDFGAGIEGGWTTMTSSVSGNSFSREDDGEVDDCVMRDLALLVDAVFTIFVLETRGLGAYFFFLLTGLDADTDGRDTGGRSGESDSP